MRSPEYELSQASRQDYDAAHRLSDIMNGIVNDYTVEEVFQGWIAVRLSDGNWDGNLYDTRKAAVTHNSDPKLWAYLATRSAVTGMSPKEAHTVLTFHRLAAKMPGFNGLVDPDHANGGKELVMPAPREDLRSQLRRLIRANGYKI